MPNILSHHASTTTKMLFIGDSGSGKTGALASLAKAGYNIRIMDLDNGLDVLKNLVRDPSGPYGPQAASRIDYETLTDPMKNLGGRLVPQKATVWSRAVSLLQKWGDLGPITSWGPQDILVIDSLTMLAQAALNFILSMNAHLGIGRVEQSEWYQGQQLIEGLLQMLYDEGVKCNVIVNCHVVYIGEENGPQRGYPASLGRALSPKIGRYFNTMLMARTIGSGSATKRKIVTNSTPLVELKTSAPLNVKPEYPLETGLAEFFLAVRGEAPGP